MIALYELGFLHIQLFVCYKAGLVQLVGYLVRSIRYSPLIAHFTHYKFFLVIV